VAGRHERAAGPVMTPGKDPYLERAVAQGGATARFSSHTVGAADCNPNPGSYFTFASHSRM
jgi:hypothetical protein